MCMCVYMHKMYIQMCVYTHTDKNVTIYIISHFFT